MLHIFICLFISQYAKVPRSQAHNSAVEVAKYASIRSMVANKSEMQELLHLWLHDIRTNNRNLCQYLINGNLVAWSHTVLAQNHLFSVYVQTVCIMAIHTMHHCALKWSVSQKETFISGVRFLHQLLKANMPALSSAYLCALKCI